MFSLNPTQYIRLNLMRFSGSKYATIQPDSKPPASTVSGDTGRGTEEELLVFKQRMRLGPDMLNEELSDIPKDADLVYSAKLDDSSRSIKVYLDSTGEKYWLSSDDSPKGRSCDEAHMKKLETGFGMDTNWFSCDDDSKYFEFATLDKKEQVVQWANADPNQVPKTMHKMPFLLRASNCMIWFLVASVIAAAYCFRNYLVLAWTALAVYTVFRKLLQNRIKVLMKVLLTVVCIVCIYVCVCMVGEYFDHQVSEVLQTMEKTQDAVKDAPRTLVCAPWNWLKGYQPVDHSANFLHPDYYMGSICGQPKGQSTADGSGSPAKDPKESGSPANDPDGSGSPANDPDGSGSPTNDPDGSGSPTRSPTEPPTWNKAILAFQNVGRKTHNLVINNTFSNWINESCHKYGWKTVEEDTEKTVSATKEAAAKTVEEAAAEKAAAKTVEEAAAEAAAEAAKAVKAAEEAANEKAVKAVEAVNEKAVKAAAEAAAKAAAKAVEAADAAEEAANENAVKAVEAANEKAAKAATEAAAKNAAKVTKLEQQIANAQAEAKAAVKAAEETAKEKTDKAVEAANENANKRALANAKHNNTTTQQHPK